MSIKEVLLIKKYVDGYNVDISNLDYDQNNVVDENDLNLLRSNIVNGGSGLSLYTNDTNLYEIDIVYNDPDNFFNDADRSIVNNAIKRWQSIIINRTFPDNDFDLRIYVYIQSLNENILGSAGVTQYVNKFPKQGILNINSANWNSQKSSAKIDGNNQAYYTILHELGHIFGIGDTFNETGKWLELVNDNRLYIGQNANREYRNAFNDQSLKGIPIEDNEINSVEYYEVPQGEFSSTADGHPEEGVEPTVSKDNRYFDNKFHPGLDHELMTGIAENSIQIEPLSRITIGMLNDLGFTVNYFEADTYIPIDHSNSGYLSNTESITFTFNNNETFTFNSNHYTGSIGFYLDQTNPLNPDGNSFMTPPDYVKIKLNSGFIKIHKFILKFQNDPNLYYLPNFQQTSVTTYNVTISLLNYKYYLGNPLVYIKLFFIN